MQPLTWSQRRFNHAPLQHNVWRTYDTGNNNAAQSHFHSSSSSRPGNIRPPLVSCSSRHPRQPRPSDDFRYAGSEIIASTQTAFDAYGLLVRKALHYGGKEKNLESTQTIEGKVTQISYRVPTGRSTLEVFRNYEAELKKAGFEPLFSCSNEACGGRNFNHAVAEYGIFGELYEDQRYLAARYKRAEGDIYGAAYVAMGSIQGGPRDTAFVQLDVIEARPMERDKVSVDMGAMQKSLSAEGHVALYNIYFATDSSTVTSESKPALDEIAKLLRSQPRLKLLVVGHTDNVGEIQ